MDESTTQIISVMRAQAWERAKGELRAVLGSYYEARDTFERMDALVAEFVERVEGEGLQE